jgi:hypothetical protein
MHRRLLMKILRGDRLAAPEQIGGDPIGQTCRPLWVNSEQKRKTEVLTDRTDGRMAGEAARCGSGP